MRPSINLFFLACSFLLFSACQNDEKKEKSERESLTEWLDVKYEASLQMSPLQLTILGRKDLYGEIDDMSEAGEDKELAWYAESVEELENKFNYDDLTVEEKTSYDLWVYQYERLKKDKEFRRLDYVFSQMSGMHTGLPNILINFHKVDSIEDMRAYISRIQETGRAINQLVDRGKLQGAEDIRPPRFTFETVIKQSKALLEGQPFTDAENGSPLWNDMNGKIKALEEAGKIDAENVKSLKTASEKALVEHFKPAYDTLIAWLEAEKELAEERPTGVSRHENGAAYYDHMLQVSTTTDLSAEKIHNIGLEEVARIKEEMMAIKEQVGFEGSLTSFFEFINTDEQFFFPNTDEGRQEYLDESERVLTNIKEKLPAFFGILPKADLIVKRVEAFREQDGAPQHYFPGTPDGSRSGIYYVHLSDMNSMPKSTLEGVAYHEGNPGHHMQISIAQELESVPQFRTQSHYTAYSEGWALYAEALAKEMGGYQNPYYDFGRLVNEIWRAIRLVVDTGLHAKGWTEADGIKYFTENSSITPGAIKAEVQRYMVMPGQATSYKIGMLKIQELRDKAEKELGDKFDIKGFHDSVLGGGAMPLAVLERQVDSWIASQKSAVAAN